MVSEPGYTRASDIKSDCLSERCLNSQRLIVCLFADRLLFDFAEVKGKLLIAKSRRGQEGRRYEGILLIPKELKEVLEEQEVCCKRLLE